MKVIHYIPSIDRTSGETTAYIQFFDRKLEELAKLHEQFGAYKSLCDH